MPEYAANETPWTDRAARRLAWRQHRDANEGIYLIDPDTRLVVCVSQSGRTFFIVRDVRENGEWHEVEWLPGWHRTEEKAHKIAKEIADDERALASADA